jgi:hypothetical protein
MVKIYSFTLEKGILYQVEGSTKKCIYCNPVKSEREAVKVLKQLGYEKNYGLELVC